MNADPFLRYHPLIDDRAAFAAALERPLPVCVWANEPRLPSDQLEAWMERQGLPYQRLAWNPGAFRLPAQVRPGHRFEYLTGLFYVQEEVSMLPVHLLDPRPGERVLDLCAAPGNKTAQIALRVGRRGTVVANDVSIERISVLRRNLGRLGVTHCATTVQDATGYPPGCGLFDRVLADVPCSCEGTSRKLSDPQARPRPMPPGKLSGLQRAILAKAVQLCRPGGRIVYSTCTFAPEENEAVVDEVLRGVPAGTLRLLPARIAGFASSPGLTAWRGRRFSPELELCLRAWPHQNDTGGFFVALLEKTGAVGNEPAVPPARMETLPDDEPFRQLRHWYGLPAEGFRDLAPSRPNRRCLSLVSDQLAPPASPRVHAAGLPFLYAGMVQPKLTTFAALQLGAAACRGFVELDREQSDAFFRRGDVELCARQLAGCEADGPVIARHQGVSLGVGNLRRQRSGGRLASLYPKVWALPAGRSAFALPGGEEPPTDRPR